MRKATPNTELGQAIREMTGKNGVTAPGHIAPVEVVELVDGQGESWFSKVNLDLNYTAVNPQDWQDDELQENYCRVRYAMAALEAEKKRLEGMLIERDLPKPGYVSAEYGMLSVSSGRSTMSVDNAKLFKLVGQDAFVKAASFTKQNLEKAVNRAVIDDAKKRGIISITAGNRGVKYNSPVKK